MLKRITRLDKVAGTWPGLIGLMLVRLVLLTALLVVLAVLLPKDGVAFFAFMAIAYVVCIPYALWLKSCERVAQVLPLQFLVDLMLVTGVVYYTGGLESDLSLLYPLVILSAGIVTTPRRALQVAFLSSIAYATLVVLMNQDVLVVYAAGLPALDREWTEVLGILVTRVAIFMLFGVAAMYVSRRCNYADREVSRFREMAEIIFRNVGAGLLLFDDKGVILMANEHACKILGQSEETLVNTSLKSHMAADWVREHVGTEKDVTQCYFRRADGSNFPVSFEIATVTLPEDTIPGRKGTGTLEAVIMAFTDIGPILDMQQQIKNAERLRAAANLAAEIAHEIRNPLAAISGSAQVLQILKKKDVRGNLRLQELMTKEQDDALERIVSESQRLDHVIERFINYTEASPEALNKLEGYIDQSRADQERMATYTIHTNDS